VYEKACRNVSDEQKFLFQSDLNRFWEIVTNDDSKARFAALETLDDLLLVEVVRYGVFNKQEMIGPLASFYRGPVMEMPEERRFAVYQHVAGFVEHTSIVSVNAFLPFIAEDDARLLVAKAVIDYVSLGPPLTDGDPMSRVKDIIQMIESNWLKNEGAGQPGVRWQASYIHALVAHVWRMYDVCCRYDQGNHLSRHLRRRSKHPRTSRSKS
jgi:hypothetical protein